VTSLVCHRDWPPSFCLDVQSEQNSLRFSVVHLSTVLVSSPQAPLLLLLRLWLDTEYGIPPNSPVVSRLLTNAPMDE